MQTPPDQSPQRRRWFQFRLRSLLLLMVVASLPLTYHNWKVKQAQRDLEAIEELANIKRWIRIDVPHRPLTDVNYGMIAEKLFHGGRAGRYPAINDQLLAQTLPLFPGVTKLHLYHSTITDEAFVPIGKLTDLEALAVWDARVAGPNFKHIAELTHLKTLSLTKSNLSDADLIHLKPLVNLEVLCLESPYITDQGLSHLRGLTKLKALVLATPEITDAGLTHLWDLEILAVPGTGKGKVTAETRPRWPSWNCGYGSKSIVERWDHDDLNLIIPLIYDQGLKVGPFVSNQEYHRILSSPAYQRRFIRDEVSPPTNVVLPPANFRSQSP